MDIFLSILMLVIGWGISHYYYRKQIRTNNKEMTDLKDYIKKFYAFSEMSKKTEATLVEAIEKDERMRDLLPYTEKLKEVNSKQENFIRSPTLSDLLKEIPSWPQPKLSDLLELDEDKLKELIKDDIWAGQDTH